MRKTQGEAISAEDAGISIDKLERAAADGLIRIQTDPTGKLRIYNYTPECQYNRQWNTTTLAARGLIIDTDGNLVARPFPKFFNLGEPDAPNIPAVKPIVADKVDGSLAIAYRDPEGRMRIATRGSFTSEQADAATRHLHQHYGDWEPEEGVTYLFEWIAPENRIVVDYGNKRDLVLLAKLDMATGADLPLEGWPGEIVEHFHFEDIDEILATRDIEGANREGYVLRFDTAEGQPSTRLKVKLTEYVALHRVIHGTNARTLWEQLVIRELADTKNLQKIAWAARTSLENLTATGVDGLGDITEFLAELPDEMYGWADQVVAELRTAYQAKAAAHHAYVEAVRAEGVTERRDIAARFSAAKEQGLEPSLLFQMWDGDETQWRAAIWRSLRPDANSGFRTLNDEAA